MFLYAEVNDFLNIGKSHQIKYNMTKWYYETQGARVAE